MYHKNLSEIIKGFSSSLDPYDYDNIHVLEKSGCHREALETLLTCLKDLRIPINRDVFLVLMDICKNFHHCRPLLHGLGSQVVSLENSLDRSH